MLESVRHHLVDHSGRFAVNASDLLIHALGAGHIPHLIIGQRFQVLLLQPGVDLPGCQHLAVIHTDFGQQLAQMGEQRLGWPGSRG
ncbi:Uncharacterised protein [Leclercia adecarboxylata]|uniref:Uncharacterized protein n=1 Tax=Leclercia adecarboxylata TaxID=83655 RepID=A0A4U9HGK9_9ENTR|nr:Uncharacterised protein [Leclercia adecarboxylata]